MESSQNLGVDITSLQLGDYSQLPVIYPYQIKNKLMIELFDFVRKSKTLKSKIIAVWIAALLHEPVASINHASLITKIHRLKQTDKFEREKI